jgi:HlyD family secretion protein
MLKKLIVLLLLAGVVTGAWYLWQDQAHVEQTNQLTLFGNIDIREAQLAFNSSEHIDEILVQEGDHVEKGQLLATLHKTTFKAEVAAAEAELEANQQLLNKLLAGNRVEDINKARAQLNAARARTEAAVKTYHRLKALQEKKLVSPEELEQARANADAGSAETEAARQNLVQLQAGPRQEDIAIARANVSSSEARLELARQKLENANLYAPDSGIIRNRILEPGDMAFPQTAAMTLAYTDPVWVRAYLPETALGKIKPGDAAEIYSDSYPDKSYHGWIGYISPTAEFTPKVVQTEELRTRLVYSVRVYACNADDELRLGMPVTVRIDTTQPAVKQPDAAHACH